jgi:FdhD protein
MTEPRDELVEVLRYDQEAGLSRRQDELAIEEPLEIRVRGRAVSVTMRTPGHDDELAAGFLLSEGIIRAKTGILRIDPCSRADAAPAAAANVLNVQLDPLVPVDMDRLTRHVFASSSCGICGKATIDAVHGQFAAIPGAGPTVEAELLLKLPDLMRQAQSTFARTGGLHAAAVFDVTGTPLAVREDVGRHNAVDKVLGHALLRGLLPLTDHILLVSGRTSFEILQKALSAGVAIIAAVSAPSSLAVEFAHTAGQTLVGFLRDHRMNVYTHPSRIRLPARIAGNVDLTRSSADESGWSRKDENSSEKTIF